DDGTVVVPVAKGIAEAEPIRVIPIRVVAKGRKRIARSEAKGPDARAKAAPGESVRRESVRRVPVRRVPVAVSGPIPIPIAPRIKGARAVSRGRVVIRRRAGHVALHAVAHQVVLELTAGHPLDEVREA